MIDLATFAREWAILNHRYNRAFDPNDTVAIETMKRYRAHISEFLNTELFTEACAKIFAEDKYFPSPERFVEAGLSYDAETLNDWWTQMFTLTRQRGKAGLRHLPERIRAAMHGHNIYARLCEAENDFARDKLKKEFIAVCRANLREGGLTHVGQSNH